MNNKIIIACALSQLTGSMCHAEDITIRFDGSKAKVEQQVKDSVTVEVNGAHVSIASAFQAHKLTVAVSGKSNDGQLILKTDGKAKVKLNKLDLTSQEGAPLWLKNKKKVEIEAANGTENTLTLTACNDTANNKSAVIWAKDKILLSGKGTLNIVATGDGCRYHDRRPHPQRHHVGQPPRRETLQIRQVRRRHARLWRRWIPRFRRWFPTHGRFWRVWCPC